METSGLTEQVYIKEFEKGTHEWCESRLLSDSTSMTSVATESQSYSRPLKLPLPPPVQCGCSFSNIFPILYPLELDNIGIRTLRALPHGLLE